MLIVPNVGVYYYHFDGLGSVIALSDTNAVIQERYSYDVFGEPNRTSDVNNPYLFTGRRYDGETGLYYYRARYYAPDIGRFLQVDPVGYVDGLNLYTYVGNNPVNQIDPKGLYKWDGPVSPVTKGLCLILKPIPYFNCGARALETGWCNGMLQKCSMWCLISGDVDDNEREDCDKKCSLEHLACVSRGMRKKCAFKFHIQG